jgi:hypothetical protein
MSIESILSAEDFLFPRLRFKTRRFKISFTTQKIVMFNGVEIISAAFVT